MADGHHTVVSRNGQEYHIFVNDNRPVFNSDAQNIDVYVDIPLGPVILQVRLSTRRRSIRTPRF